MFHLVSSRISPLVLKQKMSCFLQKARVFQEGIFQMCATLSRPHRLAKSLHSLHAPHILCAVEGAHLKLSFLRLMRVVQLLACFLVSHFRTPSNPPWLCICMSYSHLFSSKINLPQNECVSALCQKVNLLQDPPSQACHRWPVQCLRVPHSHSR